LIRSTYAVHGFKNLVLKNTGLTAIAPDLLFLFGFTLFAMSAAHAALSSDTLSRHNARDRHPALQILGDAVGVKIRAGISR
jgi:hypothetical protein